MPEPVRPADDGPARAGTVPRRRGRVFGALALACTLTALAYVASVARRAPVAPAASPAASMPPLDAVTPGMLLFRDLDGPSPGRLAGAATGATADAGEPPRAVSTLACERIHYAGGVGICLTLDGGAGRALSAVFFGPDLAVRARSAMTGIASRARVSPDGRYASTTAFVSGHSYAQGGFSTETLLWRTADGRAFARLSDFAVERDGSPFMAIDFNFWGVTFAREGSRFYATLATDGVPYLVEGRIDTMTMRVLARDVECPSLSPDGRRIAFKRMTRDRRWALRVLDLETRVETALDAETQGVDDQVEWLDDRRLLYARPRAGSPGTREEDVWALDASGAAPPVLLRARASSPAVVR